MRFTRKANHKNVKKVVGTISQTQLITTFGCGAIVDLPHDSVIIAGTDFWKHYRNEDYIIHEVNLEKLLGVDYFLKPKVDESNNGESAFPKSRDVSTFRFPETLVCSKCGKLDNFHKFKTGKKMRCPKCGETNLLPSRFVAACENGHLEDFPYEWWVHRGNYEECNNPDLHMFSNKASGGLDSILIKCRNCGKVRSMAGSFSLEALKGCECKGNRPWLADREENKKCDKQLRTAQRGGTNLYFAEHASALSIPPWSSKIQAELDNYWSIIRGINPDDDKMIDLIISSQKIDEICKCSKEEVKEQIIFRLNRQNDKRRRTEYEIVQDEYRAFLDEKNDGAYFISRTSTVPQFLEPYIDKMVLVPKLREVLALRGFRRIKPSNELDDSNNDAIAALSKTKKNWLPAISLNGEGIFFKLNENRLRDWESGYGVIKRIKIIENHMKQSGFTNNKFSARYVLLHTLSHLIIRQIILQCGYSTSSIKEKIYCTYNNIENSFEMAGILIYTATPDSEGSLGGLVNQGREERLENTFKNLLEEASWCSSDPLCIQSKGQGLNSLNLAACHSCALLPETSCEKRNLFLDRAVIVGTLDDKQLGFFSDILLGV